MKKKIVASLVLLCIIMTMIPVSFAASSEGEIAARLEQISQTSPYKNASYTAFNNQGLGSGCYAFLNAVSSQLYGVGLPSQASATTLETNSNWICVGYAGNNNNSVIGALRLAQVGDLIQYKSSYTNPHHIAMIYAVSDYGISVYHNTSSEGAHINTYAWDAVTGPGGLGDFSGSGCGLSLYQCTQNVLTTPISSSAENSSNVSITVTTGSAEDITDTSATLYGSVQSSVPVSEVGMYLGEVQGFITKLGSDTVSGTAPNMWYNTEKYGRTLEPGRLYYYQAYAIVNGQTYWGELKSFGTSLTVNMDLSFTGSDSFSIPATQVGQQITPIDVSGGVSGGTAPYMFTASGLPDGLSISSAGIISGAPTHTAEAGTATLRVADSGNLAATLTISYGAVAAAPASLDIQINYSDETITVKTGMEWAENSSGNGKVTALWDEDLPISEQGSASYYLYFGNTLYFRDGNDSSSTWTQVDIPERPDAPNGVSGGAGEITGVSRSMEYSSGNGRWTSCSGSTVSGLSAGTYQVRYQATASAFASESVSVRVTAALDEQVDWPNIYLELVEEQYNSDVNDQYAISYSTYRLMDLNGDDVPELFIFGTNEAQGDLLYTVRSNGTTSQLAVSQGDFMYDAENQLIWMPYGHMGLYYDDIYRIENGAFIREHAGQYGAQGEHWDLVSEYVYEWDGETVSESEYQNLLSAAVDTDSAVNMTTGGVSAQSIMTQLRADGAENSESSTFDDVSPSDWYYDAAEYVYENGMMNGTSYSAFSPNTTTTRGMLVTILHRLENEPAATGSGFTDVASGAYYADAVAWAAVHDIVTGASETKFEPDNPITREQMAAILYRYAQYKGYDVTASNDLSGYTDASQISAYATTAMQWANAEGLIAGNTSTTINPKGNATRAEVATILMRFCENIAQ